ncbi:MAG: replication factor C large subunit [Candidatus Bathyarchaeia archaeon]|nr:replication factor C large subunit [Candidatus Bathyarchaeota archaeon]
MYLPWTIKHKPRTLKEVIGNEEAKLELVNWIKSWDRGIPEKRAAFLYGPPGVGKTVTVEALANDFQMELIEKNASDYRTEEVIKRFAGLASQYGTLFGRRRIILLDELDGLTGNADKGGVKAITDIIKETQCPVILIANNAYDPRFITLRNYCLLIEFKKPKVSEVLEYLKVICKREGIQAEDAALKFIANRSEGDVRSAIIDLQATAQGKKILTYNDVAWLGYRDRQENIFTVLKMIIYARTCDGAKRAANMADIDMDMLFEWIYENVPSHITDPHDLARAMDALSLADIYRGRIKRTQDWSFMRYFIDYMTAGVAMSRVNTKVAGWAPFKFPQRIQMLTKTKSEREMMLGIALKIKRKCHISANRAIKEFLPYLRVIFRNNSEMAAKIAKWLELDPEMINYLTGSGIETAKKTIEQQ